MANGRMITNSICGDKRINQLSTDTSRLAFTWLVTFADREGRVHGDPAMVRSMLFPRRQDVTIEAMESMIIEWAELGLIVWYEAEGDLWIWFPAFEKNQPGMRKDKEAPSKIPEPSDEGTDKVRSRYGVITPQLPVKRIEEKRKEGNSERDIFSAYEREIGIISQAISDKITAAMEDYPCEWFVEAFKAAAVQNKRSWSYAEGILKGWKRDGFKVDVRKNGGGGGPGRQLPEGV